MSNLQNLGNLLNYDNVIGTPQKPPKLLNVNDYSNWKARFEHYISYTDSSLWIPILEGYKHPTHIYLDETMPKPISKLSDEEKKAYDHEKKALGSITMALTRKLFHSFRGNSDIKKSKRDLLRKQYECFRFLENESLDDLISRFYHLQTELKAFELRYPDEEMVEKFLDDLPPKFEMYTTLMRENPKLYELTVEEAIGKVQAHEMNLKRKESSGRPQIQDPSMYHGTTSTSKSSGSGISLFTRNPTEEDHSTGCANQSAIARIAEDHLTDPETIEEDFNQVDPDDMEDMDIQWNMAMLLRRAKRFLNRTGRKFIGGHPNAKDESFDWGVHLEDVIIAQTQVGLMAEIMEMMEAEKREASMADLEESTTAATEEEKEAEEKEAPVAEKEESTTAVALMAIGEATSSSSEVDSNPFSVISCSKCLGLKLENSRLQDKIEPLSMAALNYKENEKRFKDSIETLKKEKCEYSLKISDQQLHLDVAYRGLEKRNNEINKLQNEILQLKCTNEKLKNSRFVLEHYESVVRQMNGLGLGTNAIPPPVSGKFVNSLIDIDLTCLDESSDKDDSPKKDESSRVVSEELLTEHKVKKNVITNGDNCILTEPDIIETNDNLKVMLFGGYKSLNQAKKEVFSAHYGLGYKENLEKYYTPKNQTVKVQNTVHKPTPPAHNAKLSNAKSNEPYKRTYVDKRNCFHCGLVGHILVNSPSKNQGKRHVVSQPAVIPRSPPVKPHKHPKQNVVKPLVKPMVKTKIKCEAKLSVPRKRRKWNKRLRKLEKLTPVQSGEASTSSPAVVEPKSPVPVKKQKRSWTAKSKTSQSPGSISSKDSSILNSHHDYSGCSRHMTGNMALLQDVKPFRGGYVAFAGEKGGSITCQCVVSNGCVSFDNVNFCQQLKHNLLSVSQMCDKEYSVMFDKSECLILKPGFEVPKDWILMRAPRTNDAYQIDMSVATTTSSVPTCLLTKATELDSILWHRKLGHISYRKMNHLVRNGLVTRVPKLRFTVADDCMPCKKGKQKRKSHKPKLQNSIDTPLELLHMDLFGPISIRSIGGKSFCLVVTDDFSRFSWVHFLGTKDETADILQYLILSLESLCKLKVRRIRSDNGTEFKNNLMELFRLKKGIRHEFSAPYTPQQNGVAERKNRTLIETARTMMSDAKLPVTFWAEAVKTACHVLNRVLVVKRHNKTCYELINNRLPNLDYLVPFGSPCSLLLQYKDRQSKFHAKAVEGIFLGYVANSACKRVYNIGTRTVEEWFEVDCSKHSIPPEPTVDAANVYELLGGDNDSSFSTYATVPIITPDSNAASASGTHDSDNSERVHVEPIVPETRVHRNHPINNIIGDPYAGVQTRHRTITENTSLYTEILDTGVMETCLHAAFVSQLEPKNVKEALTDNCWIEAMQDELSQFQKLHVWDLVDFPKGFQPIGTRWVFKCKTDDRYVVVKNKARLVVQGFYQQVGLDYTEVYAPVARIEAIRLFLAYATYVGFRVYQLDVKNAFLYGKVHEEVYVTQPPGFEDPHNINKVYKLDKALYGLHQAPRAWEFEQVMKSKFEMSNMDELSFFLGLQVSQREDGIYLHQTKYVQDILSKYKMNDNSTYGTPIPVNHGLHPDKDGKDVDSRLYRGMIRSLMYLTASRPDIMFAVCLCSRFQSQPKESHMIAVKRIFRYLKGKPRLGLWYSKQQSFDFKAYTDSDYGGCNLDRKSTSGGCQFLGDRLVSWQCKKQSTVSVSTCEAEYIAVASGCSQILWIQQQLRDYGLNFIGTPLFIDNNATMSITNNPMKHSKTKHIEIRHHFIRDCAEKHLIELVKVHMNDNLADLFIKAFDRSRFEHLVNLIGMFNPE
ncbi:hypothetical protein L1987_18602 [Smallanthus sonchifolius]|uniref:Uncharacterized protein n=1 Tax=Smallanthus sonchifolius TaxID=185202 RepID=A0ACB9J3N2_9ASTR|nr:hypothetical protein L1987_18602 [Smallanthus sonchifolius]